MTIGRPERDALKTSERVSIFVVAFLALCVAGAAWLAPGASTTTERDSSHKLVKTTESPRDNGEVVLLLGAASLFLFFWGVNGLRLANFAIGPVSGSAHAPEVEEAGKLSQRPNAKVVEVPIPISPETATEPDTAPETDASGNVAVFGEPEGIYPLSAVPTKILQDLFDNWPEGIERPRDLSSFEFASRKSGRGNHPWVIKFDETPAIRVAYGGFQKDGPTVVRQPD